MNYYERVRMQLIIGTLINGKQLNTNYTIMGWDDNGKLIYRVNNSPRKARNKIAKEVIIGAKKFWEDNNMVELKQIEWNRWLKDEHNHGHWCTPSILKYLVTTIN